VSCAPVIAKRAAAARGLAQLEPRQREEAAEVLAAAFRDNPLNRAVIGEPEARRLRCNRFGNRASLEVALAHSSCRVAREDGPIRGVLVAESPASRPLPLPSVGTQLRCLWGQGWRVARRWNRVHFELERVRPVEAHWYLNLLGVDPACQGRGFGSALLREWLGQVDADGAPSYLETDRRANLPFYERAGYAVVAEENFVGVPVWRMWRQAQRKTCGESDVP
jgi:ribosomal protein S18 acetylase RimI-like enzyme